MCGCGAPLIIMKIMQIDRPMAMMVGNDDGFGDDDDFDDDDNFGDGDGLVMTHDHI